MKIDQQKVEQALGQFAGVGPRAAGSPGQKQIEDMLAERFGQAGLTVERQEFTISHWPLLIAGKVIPGIACVGIFAGAWFYSGRPFISQIIFGVLILMLVSSRLWHRLGEWIFDIGDGLKTANIRGVREAKHKAKADLILAAHHDTKSQSIPVGIKIPGLLTAAGIVIVLTVLSFLAASFGIFVSNWGVIIPAMLGIAGLIIQVANVKGNDSSGAMDNASGLSVLCSLAEIFGEDGLDNVRLTFLATGAEEMGLGGAMRFVHRYGDQFDRSRTLVVNIDTVGGGGNIYLAGKAKEFGDLIDGLKMSLIRNSFLIKNFVSIPGVGLDHIKFSSAGFDAVSLVQGPLSSLCSIHSRKDTVELVQVEDIAKLAECVGELAKRFDKQQSLRGG